MTDPVKDMEDGGAKDGVAPRFDEEAHVGHLLRLAYHLAREIARKQLQAFDVTTRQSAAMRALALLGEMSQAELGSAIRMEPANVHGLVNRLKKKKLINASRDAENPKRMRVRLTEAGRALAPQLIDASIRAENEALSKLSPDEREHFVALLRKIVT